MKTNLLRIYGDSRSGNCYKLKHLCAELDLRFEWQEVDILAGETHTEDFLVMNPNGKIPLLRLPDGRCLAESNAILCYLADGTEFLPSDVFERALALQWLFFEQYSHEPFIATSRFIVRYLGNPPDKQAVLEEKKAGGYKALSILDAQLHARAYLLGDRMSIADIALFAYTHVADEGGFDLSGFASIGRWIDRIRARPAFVPMEAE